MISYFQLRGILKVNAVMKKSIVVCLCLILCTVASVSFHKHDGPIGAATFSFAAYYESNMVLQMAPSRSIIWGFASAADIGSVVSLSVSSADKQLQYNATIKQGATLIGVWQVTLDPVSDDKPFTVTASLKTYKALVLNNVLFGDVWFCSGQSNMKLNIGQIFNSSEEAAEAEKFSRIRFFSVGQVQSKSPLSDVTNVEIHWSVPTKENILPFSAVCWLFAKNIYNERGSAIGLVESSWGGTEIEAWSSPDSLKVCGLTSKRTDVGNTLYWKSSVMKYKYVDVNVGVMDSSSLFNAMVNPVLNMTIFGVLWYQGEANVVYDRDVYNCTFPAMINDWRQKWFQGTNGQTSKSFPFGFVQIGPTSGPQMIAGYADIRWHETADFGYVPNRILQNTFMAVSYDMTDAGGGVHFRDKQTVSHRLSLSGMAIAYGKTGIRFQGPQITRYMQNKDTDVLVLEYDNGEEAITVKNKDGFEICCKSDPDPDDNLCSINENDWLPAPVTASSNTSVTLNVKSCHDGYLMGLRFVWRETPCPYKQAPVYSVENELPAPPFILRRPI